MNKVCNEDWSADVVRQMHKYRITNVQLAGECGYTPAYLSTVLNGRKVFENEETKQRTKDRIFDALNRIISAMTSEREGDLRGSTN